MGTNRAPFSSTCFYIRKKHTVLHIGASAKKKKKKKLAWSLNFTFCFIDDVFSLNNCKLGNFADRIYPIVLHLEIDNGEEEEQTFTTKEMISMCPLWTFYLYAYGVYISQLVRYSRSYESYHDFLDRGLLLTRKILNQGFLVDKLKSSLPRFYGRHHDLVNRQGVSVSQMTTDMFRLA